MSGKEDRSKIEACAPERIQELRRINEQLREEATRLRADSIATQKRLAELSHGARELQETRLAAMNLMQDAEAARNRAEMESAERRRVEVSLEESEEQFRRAIEEAPIPVIMHAEDGQVLQISRTWTDLTGFTREEIPTFEGWLTRAYGFGAEGVRARMREVFSGKSKREQVEFEILTRRGERRYWSFNFSAPGALHDGRRFAVGMALDVTDRKRAEEALARSQERLRLVIENAREYAIISIDLERRVTMWNSGAEHILGYREDEIIGQPADLIFTPEDRAKGACEKEMETALQEGRASDERWHQRKDGGRFWGSGVMTSMHDSNGQIIGFVKIFRDHSEKLRATEALEKSRKEIWEALQETERARDEAQAAGRAKDEFLGMVSHELRTPLTPVPIIVDALRRRKDLPADLLPSLERIRKSVDEEVALIDNLLELTRVTHGKLEIAQQPVDVHEAILRATQVTEDEISRKEQVLVSELSAAETEVTGDLLRLQQVFWNLLRNAAKFTPRKGAITVRSRNEENQIVVEVSDTGIGIEAESLQKIFDAFEQGSATVTREFGGLGLGLAIAQAAIKAHQGSLRAFSHGRNRGATFIISLPLRQAGRS